MSTATDQTGPKSGLQKLSALFKTDPAAEENGTWMPIAEGVRIRVRSQQSETVRNLAKQLLSQFKAAFSVGAQLSAAQNSEYEVALCSQALVVDWEGLDHVDGGATDRLACTIENVRNIVTELPHLRRQIIAYSDLLENYRPGRQ